RRAELMLQVVVVLLAPFHPAPPGRPAVELATNGRAAGDACHLPQRPACAHVPVETEVVVSLGRFTRQPVPCTFLFVAHCCKYSAAQYSRACQRFVWPMSPAFTIF